MRRILFVLLLISSICQATNIAYTDSRLTWMGRWNDAGTGYWSGWGSSKVTFKTSGVTTITVNAACIDPDNTNFCAAYVSIDNVVPLTYNYLTTIAETFTGNRSVIINLPDNGIHTITIATPGYPTQLFAGTVKTTITSFDIDAGTILQWSQGANYCQFLGDSWTATRNYPQLMNPTFWKCYNVATGGYTAALMATNYGYSSNGVTYYDQQMTACVIALGVNDYIGGITGAAFQSSMTTLINSVRTRQGNIPIFLVGLPDNVSFGNYYSSYGTNLQALCSRTKRIFFVETNSVSAAWEWEDAAHMTDASYVLFAARIENQIEAIGINPDIISYYNGKVSGTTLIDLMGTANGTITNHSDYLPAAFSDTYIKATSTYSGYHLYNCVDPSKSLIGNDITSWAAPQNTVTNQRFHIDLSTAQVVDKLYYENYHDSGTSTDVGCKTFTFWGSNTAGDFADLVYTHDGTWTPLTCSQTTFDQHATANSADPKYITVTNTTAYRYYAIKVADNWGNASYIGFRRIELQPSTINYDNRGFLSFTNGGHAAGLSNKARIDFTRTSFEHVSTDVFTFSIWFKTTKTDANVHFLFSIRDNNAATNYIYQRINANNTIEFQIIGPDGKYGISTPTYNDGKWHLYTITYSNNTCVQYIDGLVVALNTNNAATNVLYTTLSKMVIGASYASTAGNYVYDGTFDMCKFIHYNIAQSQGQVVNEINEFKNLQ